MLNFLIFTLVAILILLIFCMWQLKHSLRSRTKLLQDILDDADQLEHTLHECRLRLRKIPSLVANLPPSTTLSAKATLAAEPQVQAALRDLLAHRLWIKEHASTASLAQLQSARTALRQSHITLTEQLSRLAEVCHELERASESPRVLSHPPSL